MLFIKLQVLKINCWHHLCAAQGCRVVSLDEGVAVLQMHCPLLIMAGILNLAKVLTIELPTLHKEHHGVFTVHQKCWQWDTHLTFQGTAHTLMNHPVCETPG